jgi:hypothetical protein
MPIPIPNPIVVPAAAAQTADSLWVRSLTIQAPSTAGKISVSAILIPQISATGALLTAQAKTLNIPDLAAAAAKDPNLAVAMTAVYAAVASQAAVKNLFPASTT